MFARSKYALASFALCCLLLLSCKSQKQIVLDPADYTSYGLEQVFALAPGLNDHHTGFALYDLSADEYVFTHNHKKYFTPASNTKLLTLNAAVEYLPDSVMWMNVYPYEEGVIYEPLGDPAFLHPDLNTPPRIRDFFKNNHEPGDTIKLSLEHFRNERFGDGWSWDDYIFSYQAEMSPFPIHSNLLFIDSTLDEGQLSYAPHWLDARVNLDTLSRYRQFRAPLENDFTIQSTTEVHYIPIHIDTAFYRSYCRDMGFELEIVDVWDLGYDAEKRTIYSVHADSLYKHFIEQIDNLVGEQLLLQCAMKRYGVMNTDIIIGYAMNDLLEVLNQEINWVDGSGLSRYNLVSPNAMIGVVRNLIQKIGLPRLKHILPAGGYEGTIEDWYAHDPPRIFAKTGTLRYCHNLSGLVQAKSGKWYAFSFMHNNFNSASTPIKQEMQRVLNAIINKY